VKIGELDPSQPHGEFVKRAMQDMKQADEQKVCTKYIQYQKKAEEEVVVDKTDPQDKSKPGIKMGRLGKKPKAGAEKGAEKGTGVKEELMQKANLDDVEFLRSIIQSLTKTAAPLGKSMDFISEDIETMTKEYEMWKKQSQTANTQLEEELKKTEDTLQPLQDKLAEVEALIQEQKEKIHNAKSQIFKNEGIIQAHLNSIISK
jgi:TRAF3-interacting protein 1